MPIWLNAAMFLVVAFVFFRHGVVAFCQVLAFVVALNVFFNKKVHAVWDWRYKKQKQIAGKLPPWLRIALFIVIAAGAVGHLMFRLNEYCQKEEQRCQNLPKESLAKMFEE